jgi:hypothetical protein
MVPDTGHAPAPLPCVYVAAQRIYQGCETSLETGSGERPGRTGRASLLRILVCTDVVSGWHQAHNELVMRYPHNEP